MMTSAWDAFLAAAVRSATPLAYAALGETVVERSGVINLGLEGVMIAGALGAAAGARANGLTAGLASGVAAGLLVSILFSVFAVRLRCDQIIAGTAVTMLALGGTATLAPLLFGTAGLSLSLPTLGPWAVPGLRRLPLVGAGLFIQPVTTYLLVPLAVTIWWWLYRTHGGLMLRATGERPGAVLVAGGSPARQRWLALTFGGAMGGMAGACLVLVDVGTFADGMSAGRGFVAIAIVALGRWHPLGVVAAALAFGAASALQYLLQAMGWQAPYQLFLALPYALALATLCGAAGRVTGPAALGQRQLDAA